MRAPPGPAAPARGGRAAGAPLLNGARGRGYARPMSITADQLNKSGARGKDLDVVVREHLQIIDDKLQRAEKAWGRNIVSYDLPTNFSFPGLDKQNAQRLIYSSVISSLQKRNFVVRILLEPKKTVLYIEWVTSIDEKEVAAMNRLITDALILEEELDAYLSGAPPATALPPAGDRQ